MDYYNLDASKTFLVSLKALIVQDDRLLVLKVAGGKADATPQWELPGGLLEMDESLEAGLRREVREETSLDVSVEQLVSTWDFWERGFIVRDGRKLDTRIIVLAFTCHLVGGSIILSHEHDDYRWAAKSELAQLNLAPNSASAVRAYSDQ